MRIKIRKSNHAVSEVLGTVLLLGMAVSMFSLLSIVVLSYPFTPSKPSVNLVGYVVENNVTLEHFGGESLEGTTAVIITIQGNSTKINTTDFLNDENSNNLWDLGEKLIYPVGTASDDQIEFTVVDIKSNSIIMSGILEEEGML